jgi:ankyrin repeat protein
LILSLARSLAQRALRHLLRRGSKIHAVDRQGNTPCHLAAANDHATAATLLVAKGAGTARQRERDGANVLHLACLA